MEPIPKDVKQTHLRGQIGWNAETVSPRKRTISELFTMRADLWDRQHEEAVLAELQERPAVGAGRGGLGRERGADADCAHLDSAPEDRDDGPVG